MRGIVLAGGAGTRLYPLTRVACKQLVPVYDKPMVYYPLSTLIENGVREICLISTPSDLPRFERLLGDGRGWGVGIEYREQPRPAGIAEALLIAESFVAEGPVALILGDNVFYAGDALSRAFASFRSGATVFGYQVVNPERYGVVELAPDGKPLCIEEKPERPRSNIAIPGLYLFDGDAPTLANDLTPSARGELEITDLIRIYLERGALSVELLPRGTAWLDAGTSSSLHDASAFVQTIETRQGIKLGCPEEAAYRRGFIGPDELAALLCQMPACEYRDYLTGVLAEATR
jgi:glucose-1-phosphate thymidylyltransferase